MDVDDLVQPPPLGLVYPLPEFSQHNYHNFWSNQASINNMTKEIVVFAEPGSIL